MLCIDFIVIFCPLVCFPKAERVAFVSNADQSVASPKAGHLCFSESARVISLGTGSSWKLHKVYLHNTWVGSHMGWGEDPHKIRDVSLNTQGYISPKSPQTVQDRNKIHICHPCPFQSRVIVFISYVVVQMYPPELPQPPLHEVSTYHSPLFW